jgi:hypothetical protein
VKQLTGHLRFEASHRGDYFDIIDIIERLILKSDVPEGLCLVNALPITDDNILTGLQIGRPEDNHWLSGLSSLDSVRALAE